MFGLFVVLRVIAFLLDLVLMSLMSILISGNIPTLVNFDLGILLTARVAVNIIIRRERDIEIPPAAAINALLQPTPAPQDGKCLICHIKDFFEPRKLSCGDVFCRDCALLTPCKRDTCPKCGKFPTSDTPYQHSCAFQKPSRGCWGPRSSLVEDLPCVVPVAFTLGVGIAAMGYAVFSYWRLARVANKPLLSFC